MQHQRLSIAFTIDNGYTNQLKVVLYSLIKHKKLDTVYDIYLLAYQFSSDNFTALEQVLKEHDSQGLCRLSYIALKDQDYQQIPNLNEANVGIRKGWNKDVVLRLFLPQYLPNLDKILYLDTDILVQDDLSDLLQVDLTNKALAGVVDPLYLEAYDSLTMNNYRLAKLEGLSDDQYLEVFQQFVYINSGVLLMNLKYWRQEQLGDHILTLLQRIYTQGSAYIPQPQTPFMQPQEMATPINPLFPDQDSLNYLITKRNRQEILYLPITYNLSPHLLPSGVFDLDIQNFDSWKWLLMLRANRLISNLPLTSNNIKIVHFMSPHKPWKTAQHSYALGYAEYAKIVRWQLNYPNAKPPRVNPLKKAIKMLLPYGFIRYIQIRKKKRRS